ncbi:toll-like receptor 4 [Saccostrea echinata]|uniref:toll-like receptor 4 n=1 Tax=Saccostrea echinata TaxID=191078 RepID=UPI002A80ADF0|nr:toll-like receptor 4 [Saccostrea echinata]
MVNFVLHGLGFFVITTTLIQVQALDCSSNERCVCHKLNGKLWANCKHLHLATAPSFSSEVIGINLADNILSSFPTKLPVNILYLNVSKNNLVNVTEDSLASYSSLRNLSISENLLHTIELGSFKNSSNLVHLDISGNQELTLEVLANISSDLRKSTSIRVLNFEKLQCTYGVSFIVKKYHMADLKHTSLEELNLASNRINSLELGVLTELPKSLKYLNLANNVLSFGFYLLEFGTLFNVISINASFQSSFHQIRLKDFFTRCKDTQAVCANLSENEHGEMTAKKRLSLPLLTQFNVTVFLPPNLKTLYFHDNLYKMTLQNFVLKSVKAPVLSKVYFQNNIIYELNGPITGIERVVYADFSNNFCSYISPRFFQDFENLSYLDLSHNALGENLENDVEGEIFQNLFVLKFLNLTRNRIVRLPKKIFWNLKQLENLNLSFNSLNKFTVPVSHMDRLSYLDLSYNQISSMSRETRDILDAISQKNLLSVNLKGNELRCDCENLDFVKWILNSRNINFRHFDDYVCAFSNSSGIPFSDIENLLQLLEKQCSSYTLIIVITTSLTIAVLTITVSRILYRYRWKLRYMYYVARENYKINVHRPDALSNDPYHFDAFVSYADEDRTFVIGLVKHLEKEFNLRLCIHNRDFIPGTGIAENITNAIHNSRKTFCIMTSHFLDSYWCMFELNMARMEAIYSRNGENVLFLVALEKGIMKKLPLSFMDLIESKSYIEFPEGEDEDEITAFRSKLGDTIRRSV